MPQRRYMRQRDPGLATRVGERLRELRVAAGLTQASLADGWCTKAAISAIEHGRALPSFDTLAHFAERLGIPLANFVAEAPEDQVPVTARIRGVEIERGRVVAELTDGRIVGMPLRSLKGLLDASLRDLASWRLGKGRRSVEWPTLGLTLELSALLRGPTDEGPTDAGANGSRGRPARRIRSAATESRRCP